MTEETGKLDDIASQLAEVSTLLSQIAVQLRGTSLVLSSGRTPTEWVKEFSDRGIEISERKLRERARELGAFCSLGNAIILLPEHIDMVFEQKAAPTTKSASEGDDEAILAEAMERRAIEHLAAIATRKTRRP